MVSLRLEWMEEDGAGDLCWVGPLESETPDLEARVDDLPNHIVKLLEEGRYAPRLPVGSAYCLPGSACRGLGHALRCKKRAPGALRGVPGLASQRSFKLEHLVFRGTFMSKLSATRPSCRMAS